MIGFGTDGIRGKFNSELTIDIAMDLGKFLGQQYRGKNILIGEDTRISSPALALAIAAGAASMGANPHLMGVCPTPALAYVVSLEEFSAGVMVSASHNPYYDNGLKVFDENGKKLDRTTELEISAFLEGRLKLDTPRNHEVGVINDYKEGLDVYIKHIVSFTDTDMSSLKVVLDCANGSSITTAEKIFKDLGADVIVTHNESTGFNINESCGSTHMDVIAKKVIEHKADLGFAFDGDADRCLAVDSSGDLVDGDKILFILAKWMNENGYLKKKTVVSTVMSNLGFMKSCEREGIHVEVTDVGDKHVYDAMDEHNFKLGGEQSGHVIMKDFASTGDGVLTALKIADIIVSDKKSIEELASECDTYPQVLEKIVVSDKLEVMKNKDLLTKITEIEEALGDEGRILVRASGTEPVIRVMVEAKEADLCSIYVNDMIQMIHNI